MYPWALVSVIDFIAWHFGYVTYVTAIAGPGWHRGRFGADRIHFKRKRSDEQRVPRLRARR